MANEFLTYKGKPIVRKGNILYYGSTAEAFIIRLTILSSNNDIAEKIKVELMSSENVGEKNEKVTKAGEKIGFYEAMDLATIWLDRANAQK